MGRHHGVRGIAAVLVACSVVALPAAAATVVTSVSDSRDGATGDRIVSFRFSPVVPPFEISSPDDGTLIVLEAAPANESVQRAGLEVASGRSRMRLGGVGVRVVAVRTGTDLLELRIAGAPTADVATGYKIGPADLVSIQVYKNADISGEYSVGPDGTISLPLVGVMPASGLSESELADRVRGKLAEFLVDPQVSVTVKTYQSQYVYVTGSVPRASRVALRPAMTLNDIFSEAGVSLLPGQRFTLTHRGEAAAFATLESTTIEAGHAAALRDGDVITVEEPKYIYVQGEVRHQGRFPLTTGMTLLQAIAVAEGLTDWASKKDLRILRSVDGQKREIEVNLNKVESRKAEDPALEPGDYILVKRRIL